MEPQIIALLLSRENFEKAKALVTKDMFDKRYKTIFDAIMHYHTKYEGDLSKDNLFLVHRNLYPAMPDSTREAVEEAIKNINRNANSKIIFFNLGIELIKLLKVKVNFA